MTDMVCCPLDSGDGDGAPRFCANTVRMARKEHRCCECHEPISVGARYEHVSGCWDGAMAVYRTCLSCVEIRNHFACDGFLFEALWMNLCDNFFPAMKAGGPCMEGLSAAAKQRLFDKRTEWLLARGAGR